MPRLCPTLVVLFQGDDSHQEHITGNYPVQLEQCNFYDNATYISCDDNELIMETTIVSTIREMTEFGDCNREDFLRGVTDLCFLKPSCYVSMSTIGLDYCPMRDVCFKISYICKRRFYSILSFVNWYLCLL